VRRDEDRRSLAYHVQRLQLAGHSQREIARRLGIARRTVGRLLQDLARRRQEGDDAVARELGPPRAPKPSKLDDYDATLREWLTTDSDLTAVRCHERLVAEKGFKGRYTIVRDRVRVLRAELRPPKPTATPVVTAPGQRAEFDWSPYVLPGADVKVQLWNATLRWSRAPNLTASTDYKQTTTLRNLQGSFEEWEGVPEECLTDSMPGVVDRWECDEPILNPRYVDFAAYYGFTALIAPRACPQWKAVAERLFGFHEKNFLNGRSFRDLADYAAQLEVWRQEKKLDRRHPEDPRTIREMFELERPHLLPLPAQPYDTRDVVVRLVDDYQRVHLDTNHYPVPAPVGSRVYVCAGRDRLTICDPRARRLIEHERLPAGARIKLDPQHVRRVRYDVDELVARISAWGQPAATFSTGLRDQHRYPGPQLTRLLQLQVDWSLDDLVAAMRHAVEYGCYEVPRLERILSLRFTPRRLDDQLADSTRLRIRELMSANPVTQRPLSHYEALRTGDRPITPEDAHHELEDEEAPDEDAGPAPGT
jgi:transposase